MNGNESWENSKRKTPFVQPSHLLPLRKGMRVGLSLLATLPGLVLPLPVPPLCLQPSGLLSLEGKGHMVCA